LKNLEGWTYCPVYLLKENKEFFKKYSKIEKHSPQFTVIGSDSGEISL
jgi:inorganic pyrophosphatase